uniref:peptide-methionine (S)-S-oxide reductase n=1 Tax=Lotharella globosa TaxID=91324 RepID=A0A7S3Z7N7_9EUKA
MGTVAATRRCPAALLRAGRARLGAAGGARAFLLGAAPAGMLEPSKCLPGNAETNRKAPKADDKHHTLGTRLHPPFPEGTEMIVLGMGCFWCSEDLYMRRKGIHSTHVGYAQGVTENPTYAEVCTGKTNHNEVVRLVYHPDQVSLEDLLATFFEKHDPTTPNQQGNDMGTQYRSGIYYYSESQAAVAEEMKDKYQKALDSLQGPGAFGTVVTEIEPAKTFYYAELEHQQYDAKPFARGYCGLRPIGVPFPQDE